MLFAVVGSIVERERELAGHPGEKEGRLIPPWESGGTSLPLPRRSRGGLSRPSTSMGPCLVFSKGCLKNKGKIFFHMIRCMTFILLPFSSFWFSSFCSIQSYQQGGGAYVHGHGEASARGPQAAVATFVRLPRP